MSESTFPCPECGHAIVIATTYAGRFILCNGCRKTVDVPVPAIAADPDVAESVPLPTASEDDGNPFRVTAEPRQPTAARKAVALLLMVAVLMITGIVSFRMQTFGTVPIAFCASLGAICAISLYRWMLQR